MAGFITAVQAEEAEHADTADEAGQSDKVIADQFEAGSDILGDGLDGMLVKDNGGEVQVRVGQEASGGRTAINEDGRVQELKDGTSSIVEAAKTLLELNQVKVGKNALGTDLEGIEIQDGTGTPVVKLGELSSGVYGLEATEGEFKLVTSNLTIGKDAIGSGLPGINVNDNVLLGELSEGTYGLQVEDQSGRTIFNSNGEFQTIPTIGNMQSDTNTQTIGANSTETILSVAGSKTILGGYVLLAQGGNSETYSSSVIIEDDSGSLETLFHNLTQDGTALNTAQWSNSAVMANIPVFQAQGQANIKIYSDIDGDRRAQIMIWYS